MGIPLNEEELTEAQKFLTAYVENHRDETDTVLVRPNCHFMTEEEIEGEIMDVVLTYLTRKNCSSALKSALAREVALRITSSNLENLKQDQNAHSGSDETNNYDAMKVAKVVFSMLYELCNKWSQEMPNLSKNKFSYDVSIDAIKNSRRKMEDKHIVLTDFNVLHGLDKDSPSQAFFSVFDGHGGADAACFASSQLHCNLKKFEKLCQQPLEALRYAFTKTDADFVNKAKQEHLRSGCTAVAVLIQENTLYIAWVGDSQVYLGKSGAAVNLMEPHVPAREDERLRIEELGGCVVWFGGWRVNGSLAISRAIGDYEQKPYVCADADIMQYKLEGDEDYLILGCDGIWDTVKPLDAVELVDKYLLDGNSRSQCAKMLVSEAKSRGSMDNISVIVVFLDEHKKQIRSSPGRDLDVQEKDC